MFANRKRKYNNKKCEYQGRVFDSTKEKDRFIYLSSLQDNNVISNLQCQVPYLLLPKAHYLKEKQLKTKVRYDKRQLYDEVTYVADFVYDYNGHRIVEDVKGSKKMVLPDFKLKQKMMFYIHGIVVNLVFKPTESIPQQLILSL